VWFIRPREIGPTVGEFGTRTQLTRMWNDFPRCPDGTGPQKESSAGNGLAGGPGPLCGVPPQVRRHSTLR
jgi:hypothetical protein